jgi:predicted type IV restriction endonuclease
LDRAWNGVGQLSSKPAIIRQRDVTRIVKGAAAAGISMGIVVTNGEVRFVPVDEMKPANEPSALERWKAARHAGETRGDP